MNNKYKITYLDIYFSLISIFLIYIGLIYNHPLKYWIAFFYSIISMIFVKKYLSEQLYLIVKNNHLKIFNFIIFVIIWNICSLYLKRINGYELSLKGHSFHISYMFGNFTDFWASSAFLNTYDGQKLMYTTGYFPFALSIAQLFNLIIGFDVNPNPPMSRQYLWFLIYFFICYFPIFYYALKKSKEMKSPTWISFLFIVFIATSFPFFVNYERGNYSLITLFLLSLSFIFIDQDSKKSSILITILLSLKILNIIFLPLLFFCKQRISIYYSIIIIFSLQLFSLIFLINTTPQPFNFGNYFYTLFGNVTGSGQFSLSNSPQIFGTSGIESLRLSVIYLYNNILIDGVYSSKVTKVLCIVSFIAIIAIFILKNFRNGRDFYLKLPLLALVCTTLFHPTSADYNLSLFLPFLIYFIFLNNEYSKKIASLIAVYFIIFVDIPLSLIGCCGGQVIEGRFVSLTIKPFILVPISIYLIFFIFKSSTIRSSNFLEK